MRGNSFTTIIIYYYLIISFYSIQHTSINAFQNITTWVTDTNILCWGLLIFSDSTVSFKKQGTHLFHINDVMRWRQHLKLSWSICVWKIWSSSIFLEHTKTFPLLSTCKNTNMVKTQFTGYFPDESPLTRHLIKTKRGKKEFAAFA